MSLSGSTVHIKKFMDGMKTPEEVHCETVFGGVKSCDGCGRLPRIRITLYFPIDEMRKQHQLFDVAYVHNRNSVRNMILKTQHGEFVRVSEMHACASCQPAAEKVAAKAPSWAMVDIFRPPPAPKIIVSG